MNERPVLFSGPMVRAILDGRKTQTRRVMKPQPAPLPDSGHGKGFLHEPCPFGQPGDRLWVRETWSPANSDDGPVVLYAADGHRRYLTHESYPVDYSKFPAGRFAWTAWAPEVESGQVKGWRPSIHMPRWASRLVLQVTDVRIERLHEISEADAAAEGVSTDSIDALRSQRCHHPARRAFQDLWTSAYSYWSWSAGPWVWAITFQRLPA